MRKAVKLFETLSDETRLRLLVALRHGEVCVCRLIGRPDCPRIGKVPDDPDGRRANEADLQQRQGILMREAV